MKNKRYFKKVSEQQWLACTPTDIQKVKWMDLLNELKLPKRATKFSAGYDFYSPYTFTLEPNEEIKIPTGIRAFMNDDNFLSIYPRSGHGFKYYLRLANTVGIIDADYVNSKNEGHIFVKIRNEGNKSLTINKGDGLCQGIFLQYLKTADDISEESRDGGFGSTTK